MNFEQYDNAKTMKELFEIYLDGDELNEKQKAGLFDVFMAGGAAFHILLLKNHSPQDETIRYSVERRINAL